MTAKRITLDTQTKADSAIATAGRKYRRYLESLVEAKYGSVEGNHSHHINSAALYWQGYKRWRKKQRREEDEWTIEQAIRVEELIDHKHSLRDAAYKRLGLDAAKLHRNHNLRRIRTL